MSEEEIPLGSSNRPVLQPKQHPLTRTEALATGECLASLQARGVNPAALQLWAKQLKRAAEPAALADVEARLELLESNLQRAERLIEKHTSAMALLLEQLERSSLARIRGDLRRN